MNECIRQRMHFFCPKGMESKRIGKIRLKKVFKARKLCYSINEANRVLSGHLSRSVSAGSNW